MTPRIDSFDVETQSLVDLRKYGAEAYANDPSTDVLLFAWHPVGDPMPPQLWRRGDSVPLDFIDHVTHGGKFSGWNVVGFDRRIYRCILVARHGFPDISDEAWVDSMQLAAAANLPRSLDGCAAAVGVPFDPALKDNRRLLRITNRKLTPVPSVEDLDWLADRCVQDVLMEEQVLLCLPPWPKAEPWPRIPTVDRRINDRGVLLDVALVRGLAAAAVTEKKRLDVEMNVVTDGAVPKTTTVGALKEWLLREGVELPLTVRKGDDEDEGDEGDDEDDEKPADRKSPWRLRKADLADLIARRETPERCRRALELRYEAGKVSASKLRTMIGAVSPDGRLRGAFILMGAQQTGRASSKLVQVHNLVRDIIASADDVIDEGTDKRDRDAIERDCAVKLRVAIEAGRIGDPDLIRLLFTQVRKDFEGRVRIEGVLPFISRMSRRTIAAPNGSLLQMGDFSSIEARIPVWLAGDEKVVAIFRDGGDLYRTDAAPVFGLPPEALDSGQRQVGKVMRLSLGFAGGVGAFVPMALNYGIRISREEASPIVNAFRENNRPLVTYWDNNLGCAVLAVRNPGKWFDVAPGGHLSWRREENCLFCRLPSGRMLRYWAPRLEQGYWPDGRLKDALDLTVLFAKGRAVFRRTLWRGLAIQGPTQAIAADLLFTALDAMDANNVPVILHVHDSIAAEEREDRAEVTLPLFREIMKAPPPWSAGLPIDAKCDVGPRFG